MSEQSTSKTSPLKPKMIKINTHTELLHTVTMKIKLSLHITKIIQLCKHKALLHPPRNVRKKITSTAAYFTGLFHIVLLLAFFLSNTQMPQKLNRSASCKGFPWMWEQLSSSPASKGSARCTHPLRTSFRHYIYINCYEYQAMLFWITI